MENARLFFLLLGVLSYLTGCNSLTPTEIGASEVGVVADPIAGSLTVLLPGSHLVDPTHTVTIYPTAVQSFTIHSASGSPYDAVTVRFADGEEAAIDASVLFLVDVANLTQLYSSWQDRYLDDFILPTMRGVIRDIASQYTAEEMVGEALLTLEDEIQAELATRFGEQGLIVNDFLVRSITFSDEFTQRMEMQAIATQTALPQ
ncbi:MAG: hypothetical protein H7175_26610 [Burkholderiales bacterium]|nr:hypothetical protein [Anaerolineae bacterium]